MIRIILFSVILMAYCMPSREQNADTVCNNTSAVPFSINNNFLTIWEGNGYSPLFLKGVNLAVSVPGTQPGELAATRQQYSRWLGKIRETGFNSVRLYTLHYPDFYEVLDSFNLKHPNDPLLLVQGIWLFEGDSTYHNDLYSLTSGFDTEIGQLVDCVHGNITIPPRIGAAYGIYSKDVSRWVMAYVIGREVLPAEILKTNSEHAGDTSFSGQAFSIASGSPSETWITQRLNNLVLMERTKYKVERPVSFSSWPTLDPIVHPTERGMEDTASINIAKIDFSKAPGGLFATYHIYPYYPNFINNDPGYQMYSDYLGPNSYVGYLTDLKSRYPSFPLVIAEYGTPSGWGIAHYSQSGMNHGGFDEKEQGENYLRLLNNVASTGCGGGLSFAWIDEWFKATWITNPLDNDRRYLWHNITGPDQNFGLVGFHKDTLVYQNWGNFPSQCSISHIEATTDFEYFRFRIGMRVPMADLDTIWVSLDTYAPTLGESVLPDGHTVTNRAEFALRITNNSAELFVTQAYDLYGITHGVSAPYQLYHSIPTNGAPWNLVRWKNDDPLHDIQYIGDMKVRRVEMPPSTMDAVVISDSLLDVRLPWTLLQFSDPSSLLVINDNRATLVREDTVTDGISITVSHNGCSATPPTRFLWQGWNTVTGITEYDKAGLKVMKEGLPLVATVPITFCDEYTAKRNVVLAVNGAEGVLGNDFDPAGGKLQAELTGNPSHGTIFLSGDGSFEYLSYADYSGFDSFTYRAFNGYAHSDTSTVYIHVQNNNGLLASGDRSMLLYPNPAHSYLTIENSASLVPAQLRIINFNGQEVISVNISGEKESIDISMLNAGIYQLSLVSEKAMINRKLIVY